MAKLKLDIEAIAVESFAVVAEEKKDGGTVNGHAKSYPFNTCAGTTCVGETCQLTQCDMSQCIASCPETCKITCGDCISVDVCY
jgi:hypothetical protein